MNRHAKNTFVISEDRYGVYCNPVEDTWRQTSTSFGVVSEPQTRALIREVYAGGDILHAGAYVGDFFPFLAGLVEGRVHSFEPAPANYRAAFMTIQLNRLQNVVLENKALGAAEDKIEMIIADAARPSLGPTARLLRPEQRAKASEQVAKVDVTTIDSYQGAFDYGIIHLDLEGFEGPALLGAKETLAGRKPLLILENVTPKQAPVLAELGYACQGVLDHNYIYSTTQLTGTMILLARLALPEHRPDELKLIETLRAHHAGGAGNYHSWKALAEALRKTGEQAQAREAIERALTFEEADFEGFGFSALTHAELGEREVALARISDAMAQSNDFPTAAHLAILTYLALGEVEQAEALSETYYTEFEINPTIAMTHARILEKKGDILAALLAADRACKLRPKNKGFRTIRSRLAKAL